MKCIFYILDELKYSEIQNDNSNSENNQYHIISGSGSGLFVDCSIIKGKNIYFLRNKLRSSLHSFIMMQTYSFIILIYLILIVNSQVPPTWSPNTLINAGQHKAINNIPNAAGITNTTLAQPFNTAFSTAPRVLLGLEGYGQNPGITGSYGFIVQVVSITSASFKTQYTIYGVGIYMLYFNYFGIAYTLTQFTAVYNAIDITNPNLINPSSNSRIMQTVINNEAGQSYDTTHTIKHVGFLAGFVLTKKTDIYLTLSPNSATSYNLEVGTSGQTTITKICYFRLSFDQDLVMLGYQTLVDVGSLQGTNSIQGSFVYNYPLAAFQYRNFIFGWNNIKIAEGQQTQFLFQLAGSQLIYGSKNYQYLFGIAFHLVKRSCDISNPYFLYSDFQCYPTCPINFYYGQTTYKYCQKCHYSCLTCNPSQQSNQCTQCSPSSSRTFSSGSCLCNNGKFDNGVLVCQTCNTKCLTCLGSATTCTNCDSSLFRTLSISNTCICLSGYYQDTSGVCTSCMSGCTSCSFNTVQICSTCNTALFWKLQGNNCICIDGYFLATSGTSCNICDTTCKTCSASGPNSCASCQSANHRQLSSTSCICSNGYIENTPVQSNCLSCSPECLTCFGSITHCVSCNTTIRTLSGTTCICKAGTNNQGNGKCGNLCGDGILSSQQQCDDQNTINGDGCSSICHVQADHSCLSGVINVSLCYYSSQIRYHIENFYKQPFKNSVIIKFAMVAPNLNKNILGNYLSSSIGKRRLLATSDYVALSVQPTKITSISYDSSIQLLTTYVDYYADVSFVGSTLQTFASNSSSQKYFYNTPTAIAVLPQTFNRIATDYFEEGNLSSALSLYYAYIIILILYYVSVIFLLALNKGVIAYQIANVLLIAYYAVLPIKKIDLGFVGWSFWGKYILGFNYNFGSEYSYCKKAYSIYLTCNSFSNMNIMIWLGMLFGLFYLIIFIIQKILIWRKIKRQQSTEADNQAEQTSSCQKKKKQASKQTAIPWIVKRVQLLFLQLFFFLTMVYATMFTVSIIFQDQMMVATSIVSLSFYGIMMIFIWLFWFLALLFAQEHTIQRQLSFIRILDFQSTPTFKSFKPFYYLVYFFQNFINGLVLGLLNSYASLAIVLALSLWGLIHIAGFKWSVYSQKVNAYRALFNHICIVIILLFYLLSNAIDMGVNIALGSLLLCLLFLVIVVNCIIAGYAYFTQQKYLNQAEQKKQYIKQTISSREPYSSRNPLIANDSSTKNVNNEIVSKQQVQHWKSFIKSKNLQLKKIKKQLSIQVSRLDKTMVQSQEKNNDLFKLAKQGFVIEDLDL